MLLAVLRQQHAVGNYLDSWQNSAYYRIICRVLVTIVFKDVVLFSDVESMVFLATQRSVYLQERGDVCARYSLWERRVVRF